jgi:hypothetical protein
MSSLVQHAKYELRAAGLFDPDADYDGAVATCATTLMEVFTAYGHSGGSLEQTLAVFDKLARGKPLSPLTGEDDEWESPEHSKAEHPQMLQNKRYHLIFKDDEMAWNVAVGREPITFPYTVE